MKRTQRVSQTQITIVRHAAVLEPAVAELAMPVLQTQRTQLVLGGSRGLEVHKQQSGEDTYALDEEGRLYTWVGLVPRITSHLRAMGIEVKVVDRTTWHLAKRADHALLQHPQLGSAARAVLKAVVTNPQGQILLHTRADLAPLVALIGDFFADLHIVVVTKNRKLADALCRRVQAISQRPVTTDIGGVWRMKPRRMLVTCLRTYWFCGSHDWHVALVTDLETAIARQAKEVASFNLMASARYCVLDGSRQPTRWQQFWLDALYGSVIHRQPHPEGEPARVRVLLVKMRGGRSRKNKRDWLERKREFLWHANKRNGLIAHIAQLAGSGQLSTLLRGTPSHGVASNIVSTKSTASVAILAEGVEHARQIEACLPGWSIRAKGSPINCAPNLLDQEIATLVYADEWGICSDVVIRADGTSGWPLRGAFPRRSPRNDDVVLIDFDDRFDATAEADTASRVAAYEQQGWQLQTVDLPN